MAALVVVGSGWIGRAVAASAGVTASSRRTFRGDSFPRRSRIVIASGRAAAGPKNALAIGLREELTHLRMVLDTAERSGAERIVVLGSSDVAGMAQVVDGSTPQDPRTTYAEIKAALEDEVVLRQEAGMPVTYARLAPVHGAGKHRTDILIALARLPLVPLPNGGSHSTGFILLDDAVRAIRWLVDHSAPAVQSVGAGHTPLRELIRLLAEGQGRRFRSLHVPVPKQLSWLVRTPVPERLHWAMRIASPRSVTMDPPIEPVSLSEAAQVLLRPC